MAAAADADLTARARDLRRLLEAFVVENADEPIAWIAIPEQAARHTLTGVGELQPVPSPPARPTRLEVARRALRERRTRPAQFAGYWTAGGALFEIDGVNHRRTLEPVMRELGEPAEVPGETRGRGLETARLAWRGARIADQVVESARGAGVWLGFDPARLRWLFASAGRYLAYARGLLRTLSPSAVVTASTTNVPTRALIRAARERRTPSVFLPHAPLLGDPFYNDLPVDFAGLRGEHEAEQFGDWGADPERLDVVGNPTIVERSAPALDSTLPPVFAPLLNPPDALPAQVALVERVLGDEVVVSPHPRADVERLRELIPAAWTCWEGRTAELLEQGPPLIIQQSSGVALEALALGIPTIELASGLWPTTYPLVREPYVHVASTAAELEAAVAAARADGADVSRREALREWAQGWSRADPEAPRRAADLVRRAEAARPAETAIWDVWSDPGRAHGFMRLIGGG